MRHTLAPFLVLSALGLGLGCGAGEELVAPPSGVLRVSTLSSGVNLDPDGYHIRVDQGDEMPLGANDVLELSNVAAGEHAVALTGNAENCILAGDNPRIIEVFEQEAADLEFRISCAAPVSLGTLLVETTTSGAPTSSTGYSVVVDPVPAVAAALNGEVVIGGLPQGEHPLRLDGVPSACTVGGGNPRTVVIPAADTARVLFAVTCWPPPTGRIAFERLGDGFDVFVIRGDGTGLVNLSLEYEFLGISLGSAGNPSWSPDGRRLAVSSDDGIILIDAQPDADTPAPDPPVTGPGSFCPRWSPDGETILHVAQVDTARRVFSLDLDSGQEQTLFVSSDDISVRGCPAWSPDGSRIALATFGGAQLAGDVRIIDANGANPTSVLGGLPRRSVDGVTWSPDGSQLAFVAEQSAESGFQDIYVLTLPSGPPVAVTAGRFVQLSEPSFSPDGKRIVFRSNFRLFIINLDGSGATQLTIPPIDTFDSAPVWGPDP